MATYVFTIQIAAPQELVFDLWTNLDRMHEWVESVAKVTDVTGPASQTGSRYTVWHGPLRSPTTVLEAERPSRHRTSFGNWVLRGESDASFSRVGNLTEVTQTFRTKGLISALSARIFATGSYHGSFRGELETFKRLAEGEATSGRY